jgi:hypothetical protein
MATASIIISQPANPIPVGVAGRARQDLLLQSSVVLSNANDDGVVSWRWTMVGRPQGSAATLSSPSTPSSQFVPDVQGTYLIELSVNGAAAGETQRRVAAVLDECGFRYPAPEEIGPNANYDVGGDENEQGWAPAVEQVIRGAKSTSGFPTNATNITNGLASTNLSIGGLCYPRSDNEVNATDWIDYRGINAGAPPAINGIAYSPLVSEAAVVTISMLTVDLDTTGSTVADEWAFVMRTTAGAILIPIRVVLI